MVRGKELQDHYNSLVTEHKKERDVVIAFHNRQEEQLRRQMRREITDKYKFDLIKPSRL